MWRTILIKSFWVGAVVFLGIGTTFLIIELTVTFLLMPSDFGSYVLLSGGVGKVVEAAA